MAKKRGKAKSKAGQKPKNQNTTLKDQNSNKIELDEKKASMKKVEVKEKVKVEKPEKEIEDNLSRVKEVVKPEVIHTEIDVVNQVNQEKKKRKILFATVVAFLIIFIIAAINLMGLFVKSQSEIELPLVYVSNGEIKFISSRYKNYVSIGKQSDSLEFGIVKYSNKNDKYFLYTINDDLYLNKTRTKKESEKIASDVKYYDFNSEDDYVVYVTNGGDLYSYNYKDSFKLDTDVTKISIVSQDKVFYSKDGNLYFRDLRAKKDKEKIASDYYLAIANENYSKILYSKKVEEDKYDYHAYNVKTKKDEKVISNAYLIYDYNDDFTEFMYGVADAESVVNLSDYVEDDKENEDKNFKAYSFDDYWNGNVDYETYRNSQKEQTNIDDRNKMRETLKDVDENKYDGLPSVTVYYQKKGKSTKLVDGVKQVSYTDLGNRRLVYTKDDYSSIEKIKLSEVDSIYDIKQHITSSLKSAVMYKSGDAEEISIASDKTSVLANVIGNELYVEADEEIFSAKISKNKLENIKTISSKGIVVDWDNLYKDGLLFIDNVQGDTGDLKAIENGKIKDIDNSVYSEGLKVTWNNIYYFKNYKNNSGDYYDYNGKSKKIMSDVGVVFYVKDNYMYALKDYSSKNGTYDLYRYRNRKLELVDYDVSDTSYE